MKQRDLETLNQLQNFFCSMILSVQKCPSMLMSWDLGLTSMHLRILKEKLLLYHHISCLPKSSLAHQIKLIQEKFNLPSLKDEVARFLAKFGIVNVESFSKVKWKFFVRSKISKMNKEFMIEWSRKYKKLDYLSLSNEEAGLKEYFSALSLEQARIKFRERAQCLKTCKTHYPSDWSNIKSMFKCLHCDEIDAGASHWITCQGYQHLRQSKDLEDTAQLVGYYQDIIKLRDEEVA